MEEKRLFSKSRPVLFTLILMFTLQAQRKYLLFRVGFVTGKIRILPEHLFITPRVPRTYLNQWMVVFFLSFFQRVESCYLLSHAKVMSNLVLKQGGEKARRSMAQR